MKLLLLSLIFLSGFSYAGLGYLESVNNQKEFAVGDIFEGRIVVSPFTGVVSDIDLKEKTLFDALYIVELKEIKFSENNHESLEITFRSVVKKPLESQKIYSLSIGQTYRVELRDIVIAGSLEEAQEYKLIESGPEKGSWLYVAVGLLFLIGILVYAALHFYNKKKLQKLQKEKLTKFMKKIGSLKTREEVEQFYWDKGLWLKHLSFDQKKWENFKKHLNMKQYKEVWSSEDLDETLKRLEDFKETVRLNGV